MEQKETFKEKIVSLPKRLKTIIIVGLVIILMAVLVGVFLLLAGTKNRSFFRPMQQQRRTEGQYMGN